MTNPSKPPKKWVPAWMSRGGNNSKTGRAKFPDRATLFGPKLPSSRSTKDYGNQKRKKR